MVLSIYLALPHLQLDNFSLLFLHNSPELQWCAKEIFNYGESVEFIHIYNLLEEHLKNKQQDRA